MEDTAGIKKTYICIHVFDNGDRCTWKGECKSDKDAHEKHDSQFPHHLKLSILSQIKFGGVFTKNGWVEKK